MAAIRPGGASRNPAYDLTELGRNVRPQRDRQMLNNRFADVPSPSWRWNAGRLTRALARPGPPGQYVVGNRAIDHVAGDLGKPSVVITRILVQQLERLVYRRGQVLGEHSLGLLDDDAAAQGRLQLLGQQAALPDGPFLDQRDRGNLGHGPGDLQVRVAEWLIVAAEEFERADDVRVRSHRHRAQGVDPASEARGAKAGHRA